MIAFDTNILIYAYDSRDTERQGMASSLLAETSDGVLLWQVACEFLAAARKLREFGFTDEHKWLAFDELRGLLRLQLPNDRVLIFARRLCESRQLQFWDALIYAACIEAGVTRLYSEDLPGQAIEGLEIVNPFAGA